MKTGHFYLGKKRTFLNWFDTFVNNDLKNGAWCDNFQKICNAPWSLMWEKITEGAHDA